MAKISMIAVRVYLKFLQEHRAAELERTTGWALYGAELRRRRAQAIAWRAPKPPRDARLRAAHEVHRAWTRRLRAQLELVAEAPTSVEGEVGAARALLRLIRKTRGTPGAIAVVRDVDQDLELVRGHLAALPEHVSAWFEEWLRTGEALEGVVAQRYGGQRPKRLPRTFKSETAGIIRKLREAIRHEVAMGSQPANLEKVLFGYWDELIA